MAMSSQTNPRAPSGFAASGLTNTFSVHHSQVNAARTGQPTMMVGGGNSFSIERKGMPILKNHFDQAFSRTSVVMAAGAGEKVQRERSFIMIKPDGVQRGLVGQIIQRFEQKGFQLIAMKLCAPGKEMFEKHYSDLKDKPFFPDVIAYASSGPVCCMVWEGANVVASGRKMLGATKPFESDPGTIRGDFCIDVGRNICHGSDSVDSANKEIDLWFDKDELLTWDDHSEDWIYE